jgi:23S rRNA pseudouridine1911/1915/1917 synthase
MMNTSTTQTTIEDEHVGTRLDKYVTALLPELSRTSVQQRITEGAVLVNDKQSKPGYLLRLGDVVHVTNAATARAEHELLPLAVALDIVYEDDDLLVINKPAGMVVHPAPGHYEDTLVNALVARYPELAQQQEDLRPGIVHRLDRDTSGLIIVAKNLRTQAAFVEQMKQHEVEKRYIALVEGVVELERGSIDAPIGRDRRHRQQMTITTFDSREARTHFKVLQRFSRHTLLLLQLETGRTHQIRVHLKAIGHPVIGDPTYGTGRLPSGVGLTRQFLHASHLRFQHPFSGEIIEVDAPLPPDLQTVLDQPELL